MFKIGGNWHKIHVWKKENCIVAYKSGGIIFLSLLNYEQMRYLPFYNFKTFYIDKDILFIADRDLNLYRLNNIFSHLSPNNSKIIIPRKETLYCINVLDIIDDVRAFDITDKFIICAYKQKGIDIFDNQSKKKLLHFDFPGYSFVDDLVYYDDKIFIADVFGLRILDITNIRSPILNDFNTFKGWPKDVAVDENFVYIADVLGIKIFDKYNKFKLVGKFETNKNRVAKLVIKNNLAFLGCEASGLKILDISNPENPKPVSGLLLNKGAWDIFEYNNCIYIAAYTEGVYKVSYSNLKALTTVAKYTNKKEYIGIYVNNIAVFASCSFDGIDILDHQLNLIKEIKITNGRCWTTLAYNDLLFAACGKVGVMIYDIRDIHNPVLVNQINTVEARDLIIKKNILYIADGQNGVEIYDINDILFPKKLKNIPSAAFTRGIMVDEKYIYKADGDGGLEIYEKK